MNKNGPINPTIVHIMALMFLCREVEAGTAERKHITMDAKRQTVSWLLPVSKTDVEARGCTRSWSCLCEDGEPFAGCPYHAMEEHLALLETTFGAAGDDDDLPLFPTVTGEFTSADSVMELIETLAQLTGEVMVTAEGKNRFGRHSWRAAGAVYITSLGLEVVKIQMLVRWESALITHYARLAPLKTLGDDFKAALRKKRSKTTTSSDIYQPDLNKKTIKALMDTQLDDMKVEIDRLETLINKCRIRMPSKTIPDK